MGPEQMKARRRAYRSILNIAYHRTTNPGPTVDGCSEQGGNVLPDKFPAPQHSIADGAQHPAEQALTLRSATASLRH
jgi:hypothetical protein